ARLAGPVSLDLAPWRQGTMVGIDMSRAFDTLARDVLLRSLQHAGVDASLQRILIEIHEACQYEISHMQHTTQVPMGTGVRQGCAVSPLLYSLFTAWFLAELEVRTSPSWVQHLVTCFADDTHLAWEIEQYSDLTFFCTSLRATFQLLRECKMLVNSDKSTLVLGLRGAQAKRWIRTHLVVQAGKKCLDMGTPGAPLCIPVADQFVYLGTKQHLRLSHVTEWMLKDDADSLCSSAGSAAIAYLCLDQEDGARGRGQSAGGGPPGDARCLGRDLSTPCSKGGTTGAKAKQEAIGGGPGARPSGEVEQASLQGTTGEGTELERRELEDLGASTSGSADGQRHPPLLRTLVKTTLRLDEDVSRLRTDCNFMLFVDSVMETNTLHSLREAAQKWQEAFVEKKVSTSLRVILFCGLGKRLREAVEQVQTDDELKDRLLRVGWLEDGINALLPAGIIFDGMPPRKDKWSRKGAAACQNCQSFVAVVGHRGDTMQALIDAWSSQSAVHALESHSGLVILQLKRYSSPEGVPAKNSAPVLVQPGEALAVPVFAVQDSLDLLSRQFRVAFVIYHHGVSPHGGHYQAALSMSSTSDLTGEWQFYICDDGIVPKRAASADLKDILHNAYLIGLVRGDALHCQ
ncbi:unnamed protein product, partial [Symbiodinium microadriaticum]